MRCPKCFGEGTIQSFMQGKEIQCPKCKGRGKVGKQGPHKKALKAYRRLMNYCHEHRDDCDTCIFSEIKENDLMNTRFRCLLATAYVALEDKDPSIYAQLKDNVQTLEEE